MSELKKNIKTAASFITSRVKVKPKIAIILGTGLGGLAKEIKSRKSIDYSKIPHFPVSTVKGHKGELIFGEIAQKPVVAMDGRFHYYEGYSLEEITLPVRVMRALGAEILIVSNASGGLNPQFNPGDIMLISDHINLMGVNPLIGPNDDTLGPRFPDMSEPYNRKLLSMAEQVALDEKLKVHKGVYLALTGPNLETAAEYRFLRLIGTDVVGMSTVPEVIVGVHCGFKILGFSCITDCCLPDALKPADINEIIKVANMAEPKLTRLVCKIIERI